MSGDYKNNVEKLTGIQTAALKNWVSLADRSGTHLPCLDTFLNSGASELLPEAVLFRCHSAPRDFEYVSIGRNVADQISANFEAKRMSALPGKGPGSKIWSFLVDVLDKARPDIEAVPYVGPNSEFSHASLVALPLTEAGTNCPMIMLVVTFEKWPFLRKAADLPARVASLRDFLEQAINEDASPQ